MYSDCSTRVSKFLRRGVCTKLLVVEAVMSATALEPHATQVTVAPDEKIEVQTKDGQIEVDDDDDGGGGGGSECSCVPKPQPAQPA